MLLTVENLRKDDLVLYAMGSKFIMARILKDPQVNLNPPKWRKADVVYYKSVKMSMRREPVTTTHVYGENTYTRTVNVFILDSEGHNFTTYVNPNNKQFWLIERRNVE